MKGILLDYGGTIDTNGVHWASVIWGMYQQHKAPVLEAAFKAAYKHGERTLALQPLILPEHNFLDVMRIKIDQQFIYLEQQHQLNKTFNNQEVINRIATACNDFAVATIAKAAPVLEALQHKYELVVVSNFYGNIQTVLETFGIGHYFTHIIESVQAGVRKPDPEIFRIAVKALDIPASACVVVGDTYTKDIVPGAAAGCKTIWLQGKGWEPDPADTSKANIIIQDFKELPDAILTAATI